MIPYVRNHYPYVRNHYLVRTQSLSRTYAIIIPYVRNHHLVRTQSSSRTYAIIVLYVRNHYLVRAQSLSRTYAIIMSYVRNDKNSVNKKSGSLSGVGGGGVRTPPPTARAQFGRHILQCFCRNYYYYRNNY